MGREQSNPHMEHELWYVYDELRDECRRWDHIKTLDRLRPTPWLTTYRSNYIVTIRYESRTFTPT